MADSQRFEDAGSADDAVRRLQRKLLRDQADGEALALWDWLRQQSLQDVLRACLDRGDLVTITVLGGTTFRGELVHVGSDLACVETTTALVNVNLCLPVVVQVTQRVTQGGRPRAKQVQRFHLRLEEYEFEHQERPLPQEPRDEELLEFGSPLLPEPLRGRISAVGPDVVYLVDRQGTEWYVPLAALAYVARPTAPAR
jgi:hypothetical protein